LSFETVGNENVINYMIPNKQSLRWTGGINTCYVTSSDESTDELVAFILTNENEPKDENKKKMKMKLM